MHSMYKFYELLIRRSRSSGGLDPSLVFYMPFTDSATADIAGGRTMQVTGTVSLTTVDDIPCASVGGGNKLFTDVLAGANGDLPTGNESWTVCCFAYFPSLSWANNFFALGTNSGRKCILQGPKGGHPIYNNYGPDHEPGSPQWTTGVWHHTAATYDGTTMTLKGYFDGQPNGTWSLANQGLSITLGGVHMGEFGGYQAATSYIASPRIYNRVLTDVEIADLANEFTPYIISDTTMNFWRDGSNNASFSYKSVEPMTFAIETGYSLPSGITMNGNTFTCDGTTTVGSYTVVVRGTTTENPEGITGTMTLVVANNAIDIETTALTFIASSGAQSKPVIYTTTHNAITPVFTLTGTLPAGITFNSTTGVFTSDGTQTATETATVSVTVASSTGLSATDTQTITLYVFEDSGIPTDTLLYLPLAEDTDDESQYARTMSVIGNSPTFGTVDGVPCAYIAQNDALYTTDSTGVSTGDHDYTMSYWMRLADLTGLGSWLHGFFMGWPDSGKCFNMGTSGDYYYYSIWSTFNGNASSPTPEMKWHHFVFTHTSSGENTFYIDGTQVLTNNGALNLNTVNMCVGGSYGASLGNKMVNGYYAGCRIYDRVLTSLELALLDEEFTPSSN